MHAGTSPVAKLRQKTARAKRWHNFFSEIYWIGSCRCGCWCRWSPTRRRQQQLSNEFFLLIALFAYVSGSESKFGCFVCHCTRRARVDTRCWAFCQPQCPRPGVTRPCDLGRLDVLSICVSIKLWIYLAVLFFDDAARIVQCLTLP